MKFLNRDCFTSVMTVLRRGSKIAAWKTVTSANATPSLVVCRYRGAPSRHGGASEAARRHRGLLYRPPFGADPSWATEAPRRQNRNGRGKPGLPALAKIRRASMTAARGKGPAPSLTPRRSTAALFPSMRARLAHQQGAPARAKIPVGTLYSIAPFPRQAPRSLAFTKLYEGDTGEKTQPASVLPTGKCRLRPKIRSSGWLIRTILRTRTKLQAIGGVAEARSCSR